METSETLRPWNRRHWRLLINRKFKSKSVIARRNAMPVRVAILKEIQYPYPLGIIAAGVGSESLWFGVEG